MKGGHALAILLCLALLIGAWVISIDDKPTQAQSPVSPIETPTGTPTDTVTATPTPTKEPYALEISIERLDCDAGLRVRTTCTSIGSGEVYGAGWATVQGYSSVKLYDQWIMYCPNTIVFTYSWDQIKAKGTHLDVETTHIFLGFWAYGHGGQVLDNVETGIGPCEDAPVATPTSTPTSSGEWYDVCPVDLEITATPYVQPTYTPQATYTPVPVPTCRATVVAVISGPSPTLYPTQTPYPTATPWPAQP